MSDDFDRCPDCRRLYPAGGWHRCDPNRRGPGRRRRGYILPDDFERNREHYDHKATADRQRIVDNRRSERRVRV